MNGTEARRASRLAAGLLWLSGIAAGWALLVAVTGGFDVAAFGHVITAHNPVRPMLIATVALALYLAVTRQSRPRRPLALPSILYAGFVSAALAVAVAAVTFVYGAKVAGGSDSWGYLSSAGLMLDGRQRIDHSFAKEVPWPDALRSFTPLAYRPDDADSTIVPIVSPGLPLMLAAAKELAGSDVMFAVIPIFGGLVVFATFGIGTRLASPLAGLVGAWLVATSPVVLYMSIVTMSDIPVAALFAASIYFLFGSSSRAALAAGLLAGAGLVVRPNLIPLLPVMALRYVLAGVEAKSDGQRRDGIWFLAGASPFMVALAIFNTAVNGSPLTLGYGRASEFFHLANVWPNVVNNVRWMADTHTLLGFAGLAAILIPSRRLWPAAAHPRWVPVIALFVAALVSIYCLYIVFDAWMYLRFLLPAWPLVMVGTGALAVWLMTAHGRAVRAIAAMIVITLGLVQLQLSRSHGVFTVWADERRFIEVGRLAGRLTEENSVILSMQHSGSLRYYGGRMTLRYDAIDASWIDRAVEWLGRRGVHTYLVAEDWEVPIVERRFAGTAAAAALARPARGVYGTPAKVLLFDLSAPPEPTETPAIVTTVDEGLRASLPVRPPNLTFRQ